MKFSIFFLLPLQLNEEISSANGLICFDCISDENEKLEQAMAEKEGRIENKFRFPRCETLELLSDFGFRTKEGKESWGSEKCKEKDADVCIGHMYDVELDGKIYKTSNFECSSQSELIAKGFAFEIGYCIEIKRSQTENRTKGFGGKISNNRICACDKDLCDPLILPYPSVASTATMASVFGAVSILGVIFTTINGIWRF